MEQVIKRRVTNCFWDNINYSFIVSLEDKSFFNSWYYITPGYYV